MRLHLLRPLLTIVLAFACTLPLAARAVDYTDIWWAGAVEDGWGVNMIQSEDVIFATFFVYGPAPGNQPIWYAVTLTRDANGIFAGDLYQSTGTGIGVPYDPAQFAATKVGTATFTPTSSTTGTLDYNVNTTNVSKQIQRQTLTTILLGGTYYGTGIVTVTGCDNSAQNATQILNVDPLVMQTLSQLQIVFQFGSNLTCTMTGAVAQEGQLFRVPSASYICNTGAPTTSTLYEIKQTSIGIEGRWFANIGGGCREDGSFSGVLY
jgi:hypothetical protein